jgi:hypothetical protein
MRDAFLGRFSAAVRKVFKDIFTMAKNKPFTVYPNLLKRLLAGILGTFTNQDSLISVKEFHNTFSKALESSMNTHPFNKSDKESRGTIIDDPFILLLKVAIKKDWERFGMACYYVIRFFFKSLAEHLMKK